MTAKEDRDRTRIRADYLKTLYKQHVVGGIVRSTTSIVMWCASWIAHEINIIPGDNFMGVSLGVLYITG